VSLKNQPPPSQTPASFTDNSASEVRAFIAGASAGLTVAVADPPDGEAGDFDAGRIGLEDARHQMPADFRAIVPVAGKVLGKELFFVQQPPNETKDRESARDETPVGAERQ
jgi:hypothetical protein